MSNSVRPHGLQPTRLRHPWDSPGKNTGVGCHFLLQCMKVKSQSEVAHRVRLLATPWAAAHQAPPSMGFSRQEYWRGLPLPSPEKRPTNGYFGKAGDLGSIRELGRSPGEEIGYPLQCSGTSLVAQLVKNCLQCGRPGFDPWVGKMAWKRERLPTPVLLPSKSHGQRSLVGCSPWGC